MRERKEFFAALAELMKEHNVAINATDNGAAYGMHLPLVEFDFVDNYDGGEIEVSSLDAEECAVLGEILVDGD